jgi:hypothetical protein
MSLGATISETVYFSGQILKKFHFFGKATLKNPLRHEKPLTIENLSFAVEQKTSEKSHLTGKKPF